MNEILPGPPVDGQPWQYQKLQLTKLGTGVQIRDADSNVTVAVPAAEWFVFLRNVRTLTPLTWIDVVNKSCVTFRPYLRDDVFDIAVEVRSLVIGERFAALSGVL